MNKILSSVHRRLNRRVAIATLGLAVAAGGVVAGQSAASAYTSTSRGSPGTTTTPFTWGTWGPNFNSTITVPYRTVYESPAYATYAQTVCVTPRLYAIAWATAYSPATWVLRAQTTNCATIPARSSSTTVNGFDFYGSIVPGRGYGVDIRVQWKVNGTVVGTRTYDYSQVNDYRCANAGCMIGLTKWGGGAFMQFSG